MAGIKRSIEMLVLGLLVEGPDHAYHLKKSIDRLIGRFHKVSDGMLYPLLRELEGKGYLSGHVERGGNAPDRVVYQLTEAGRTRLDGLLDSQLVCSHYGDIVDFYSRLALFGRLTASKRIEVLKARLEVCDSALQKLAEAAAGISGDKYELELIRRAVAVIEGECEWLLDLISMESAEDHAVAVE